MQYHLEILFNLISFTFKFYFFDLNSIENDK